MSDDGRIDQSVRTRVLARLDEVERTDGVRVLYACESGSRAWGFESADSDYDVRFLYVHRRDWYLSIDLDRRPDVIEPPIEDELDVCGWDLRKALGLLRKSNPPLLEWVGSPIVYREAFSVAAKLRELRDVYYSRTACMYHYLKMARNNYREFLRGPEVPRKKYLYVLRPILAVLWIERDLGVVPTQFGALVERLVEPGRLRSAIDELLRAKCAGAELGLAPRIPQLNEFIERELARLEKAQIRYTESRPPVEELSRFFVEVLDDVWGSS